jgi:tRNA(Ile)-lysidine synthase
MQTNLLHRIRSEVERYWPPHLAAVIGVSGGPDSMCLADAAITLGRTAVLAHLHHGLRGDEADADAAYVRDFATGRGVPVTVAHENVSALAANSGDSIEVAARRARYAFLAAVACTNGLTHVVVGHHADDQAETVLLRLIRGTGPTGLRGMLQAGPVPGAAGLTLLRPLLRLTRAEIDAYCVDARLQPRIDSSNLANDHTRNRVRHELLPVLERFNPGIRAVLARLADTTAADVDAVAYATAQAMHALVSDDLTVDRVGWRALPVALQRGVLRACVQRLRGDLTDLPYAAIEEARDVLNSDAVVGEIALMRDVRVAVRVRTFHVSGG